MPVIFAIGQDSHAFETAEEKKFAKPLLLAGVEFPGQCCLAANSDGDVVLHALTNAVSGLTTKNVLGKPADLLCQAGITDSAEYLKSAMKDLSDKGLRLIHLSFSIEALVPKFSPKIEEMRDALSRLTGVSREEIGITATTGEGLTAFGRGEGIMVFCAVTAETKRGRKPSGKA